MPKKPGIPGLDKPGWLKRKAPLKLITSVPPILAAAVTAYNLWGNPIAWLAAGGAAWLTLGCFLEWLAARAHDREESVAHGHEGLTAALMVLQTVAGQACGIAPADLDDHLRVTFHRVVEPIDNPEEIEQLVDYVGGSHSGAGRKFDVHCGITGRAIRDKSLYTANARADAAEWNRELVSNWGYTDANVRKLTMDRNSLIAVPVLSSRGRHAIGVVYLDSDLRNLFDAPGVEEMILRACAGIANYVNRRYEQ
jgi:hypothetical protein